MRTTQETLTPLWAAMRIKRSIFAASSHVDTPARGVSTRGRPPRLRGTSQSLGQAVSPGERGRHFF